MISRGVRRFDHSRGNKVDRSHASCPVREEVAGVLTIIDEYTRECRGGRSGYEPAVFSQEHWQSCRYYRSAT